MSKVPKPGNVKTRLRPFLSDVECVSLSTAFLRDTEAKAAASDIETVFAVAPASRMESMATLLNGRQLLIGQTGPTLGERMCNAFGEVLEGRADAAVMIGTDSPAMPAEYIQNAAELLAAGSDAVIGPSEDGGFYLIGLRSVDAAVFESVDWGTHTAFDQTMANLEKIGSKTSILPVCYDIDVEADLRRLYDERELLPKTAGHTLDWLDWNAHLFKARS